MKLHKDGTVEGTPQEISEYMKTQDKPLHKVEEWHPHGTGITTPLTDTTRKLLGLQSDACKDNALNPQTARL